MEYQVRRFCSGDEEKLFSFRKTIFPPGSKHLDPQYFHWKFLQCPYDDETPFFVLESEGKIVGTQGYWPIRLVIDGHEITCRQLVDFNVDEKFRGMPVIKLFKATCSNAEAIFTSNLSNDARRFFTATRWTDKSTRVNSHYLFLKPAVADHMGKLVKFRIAHSIAKARQWFLCLTEKRSFAVEFDECMPSGFESLLTRDLQNRKILFCKNSDYYTWRYTKQNQSPYRFASLFEHDTLKAAIVFRMDDNKGCVKCHIMDIVGVSSDPFALEFLMCRLVNFCETEKDVALVTASSLRSLDHTFKACGFRTCTSNLGLMINNGFSKSMGEQSNFDDLNFMLGDTDIL